MQECLSRIVLTGHSEVTVFAFPFTLNRFGKNKIFLKKFAKCCLIVETKAKRRTRGN